MNYEKEFLDYLHANGMSDVNIFDVDKADCTLFEKQLISVVTSKINELLAKMSSIRNISPLIHVFCIADNIVNAFCFVKNNNYYIGIHSGTYIELMVRTERLANYIVNNGLSGYSLENATELQASLWIYAFKMILAHEYMHLILGHCDIRTISESFLWERDSEFSFQKENSRANRDQQALEMFADEFASMDMALQIVDHSDGSISEIKKELLKYYMAILLVFSIFEDDIPEEKRKHPRLGVRLHYITAAVDDAIYKGLNKPNAEATILLEEIDSVIDEFMSIIRRFSDLFTYDIVASLGGDYIEQEYIDLYNLASDLVKETNRYALFPIREFEKVDSAILVDLSGEKNLLKELAEKGRTYNEARRIIEAGNGWVDNTK